MEKSEAKYASFWKLLRLASTCRVSKKIGKINLTKAPRGGDVSFVY